MSEKQIVIEIDENGEIKLETFGFKGKSCIDESQFIKDMIGKELHRELKPCYFTKETDKKVTKKWLNICG